MFSIYSHVYTMTFCCSEIERKINKNRKRERKMIYQELLRVRASKTNIEWINVYLFLIH